MVRLRASAASSSSPCVEAEGVVDPLDVVEVEVDQRRRRGRRPGAHQRLRDAVDEEPLVGQTGQGVVQGGVGQPGLRLAGES